MIVTGAETPILRTVCERVGIAEGLRIGADLKLAQGEGIGLAAPQIGENARVFIMRGWPEPFINPELVEQSFEREVAEEGCMSLPGIKCQVERARKIKLRWQRPNGEWTTRKLRGMDARCAQHELDHLDGVLIVDY